MPQVDEGVAAFGGGMDEVAPPGPQGRQHLHRLLRARLRGSGEETSCRLDFPRRPTEVTVVVAAAPRGVERRQREAGFGDVLRGQDRFQRAQHVGATHPPGEERSPDERDALPQRGDDGLCPDVVANDGFRARQRKAGEVAGTAHLTPLPAADREAPRLE